MLDILQFSKKTINKYIPNTTTRNEMICIKLVHGEITIIIKTDDLVCKKYPPFYIEDKEEKCDLCCKFTNISHGLFDKNNLKSKKDVHIINFGSSKTILEHPRAKP